jgi:hypothetical protein
MSVTIQRSDRFPVGTEVKVFPALNKQQDSSPSGVSVTSAVVATDGTLTFSGLAEGAEYVAYAKVGNANRYVGFAESHFVPGESWAEKVAFRKANPV